MKNYCAPITVESLRNLPGKCFQIAKLAIHNTLFLRVSQQGTDCEIRHFFVEEDDKHFFNLGTVVKSPVIY